MFTILRSQEVNCLVLSAVIHSKLEYWWDPYAFTWTWKQNTTVAFLARGKHR